LEENQIKNAELMKEVINVLAAEILKTYKVDKSSLFELLSDSVMSNKDLIDIIEKRQILRRWPEPECIKIFPIK